MYDPYNFMPAVGRRGRWTAFVQPFTSRLARFHILRRSHKSDGMAVVKIEDGKQVIESIREFAVRFDLVEFEEGEFPKEPTIESNSDTSELQDFLQAVVDCAYSLGITPTKFENREKEIAAIRAHLDDMREIAKTKKQD